MRWWVVSLFSLSIALAFGASRVLAQSSADSAATDAATSTSSATDTATEVTTFWGLIAKIPKTLAKCKKKLCKSCCGQLINEMTKPISLMTGGCLQCCPQKPDPEDAKKAGPAGAAAALQLCLAEAPERIEAVRFLAQAECSRFPEAEKTLIDALRADCAECVRWEAAKAFATGCCCTKNSIEALTLTVNGGTTDGNPPEKSPRVKEAAQIALEHCLNTYIPEEPSRPEQPVPPELPSGPPTPQPATAIPPTAPATPQTAPPPAETSATGRIDDSILLVSQVRVDQPAAAVDPTVRRAQHAIAIQNRRIAAQQRSGNVPIKTGERSIFHIFQRARGADPTSTPSSPVTTGAGAQNVRSQNSPPAESSSRSRFPLLRLFD